MDPENNTSGFYPPVSFYFEIEVDGSKLGFQEASGINMEIDTEEVVSGGENEFKLKLPGVAKFTNLVLKRGLVPKYSSLATWVFKSMTGGYAVPITTKTITVRLLDSKKNALITWDFINAYPVKWNASDLKSMDNSYVVESLEFAYNNFIRH